MNTANLLAEKGNKVSLVILDQTPISFYPVHPSIQIIQQPLSFGITPEGNIISRKIRLLSDVLKLKRIIRKLKADVVIASEYPFAVASVLAGTKKYSCLYAWEHHHHAWLQKNKFWTFLCNQAYPKLTGIICLNKTEAAHYNNTAPVFVIPNFIENPSREYAMGLNKKILSISWLIPRKGIDLMLKVAQDILTKHPDWTWKLIGEGEMKEQVLQYIQTEKLGGRFILQAPAGANIQSEYLDASVFVLSSRFEAFPMVLLEAMAAGVPCVSFDCPSGPADIITDGSDGFLVTKENTEKLSEAIQKLISNEELRIKMGKAAAFNVQRFSPDTIYNSWKEQLSI